MKYNDFFWLHIKKSAGTTVKNVLSPDYVIVDHKNFPKNFIQAKREEYNDILNNYRVVLGRYQFKRALFAKKFLYKDDWSNIYSFAFSREPIERCVSMFHYLYWGNPGFFHDIERMFRMSIRYKKFFSIRYAFDAFLEDVELAHNTDSIYRPKNLHFTTHVAKMWDDITDEDGKVILKKIYRLENIEKSINEVFETVGINKKIKVDNVLNKGKIDIKYVPNEEQTRKIMDLFSKDFEIYELSK